VCVCVKALKIIEKTVKSNNHGFF